MNDNVDRFDCGEVDTTEWGEPCVKGEMYKTENGEYVKFSDYKKLQEKNMELLRDNDNQLDLIMRQAKILTETANSLKGEPAELSRHSHHDLKEVADKLVNQRDSLLLYIEQFKQLCEILDVPSELWDLHKQSPNINLIQRDREAILKAIEQCVPIMEGNDNDLSEFNNGYNSALATLSEYANQLKEEKTNE